MLRRSPTSLLFPYTTLFRSLTENGAVYEGRGYTPSRSARGYRDFRKRGMPFATTDRKSTRLNSSHLGNSYAVFCLKKKKYCKNPSYGRCVAITARTCLYGEG